MFTRIHRPSAGMVVALLALFISLTGTAVAAGVVPLAKRALIADNAKKLQGKTAAQVATQVRSVASLITVKTAPWSLNPSTSNDFTLACDAGQKAISGGYDNPSGSAISFDNRPSADGGSWRIYLVAADLPSAAASGTLYAVCLK